MKHCLSYSFLLTHSSAALAWIPTLGIQSFTKNSNVCLSHSLQFYKSCSGMGPFHVVQSFRKSLFQCGFPMAPLILPGVCSCMGSPQSIAFLRAYPPVGSQWPAERIPAPPWSFTGWQSLFHHSLGPAELFLSHILNPPSQLLLHNNFYPIFNALCNRGYHCHWLAQLWPEAGPSSTLLELQ